MRARGCRSVPRWLCVALSMTVSLFVPFAAADAGGDAWNWSRVELEARKFLLVARMSVTITAPEPAALAAELVTVPEHRGLAVPAAGVWRVEARNHLPGVNSRITVWLARDTLQLLQRERLDSIHGGRYKLTRILEDGSYEWQRRGTGVPRNTPAKRWPVKRARFLPAERTESCSDSLGLLLLAPELVRSGRMRMQARLCTDGGSIPVVLTHQGDAVHPGRHERIHDGARSTSGGATPCTHVGIALEDEAKGASDDFRLLGLTGRLQLCVDRQSGAPLRLTGIEPRLGSFTIDATLLEYGADGGSATQSRVAPPAS